MFTLSQTEECDEDNLGGVGPSCGKHQAQCGQTGGQFIAEQQPQYQHRTHSPQHTGSHSSEYYMYITQLLSIRTGDY